MFHDDVICDKMMAHKYIANEVIKEYTDDMDYIIETLPLAWMHDVQRWLANGRNARYILWVLWARHNPLIVDGWKKTALEETITLFWIMRSLLHYNLGSSLFVILEWRWHINGMLTPASHTKGQVSVNWSCTIWCLSLSWYLEKVHAMILRCDFKKLSHWSRTWRRQ